MSTATLPMRGCIINGDTRIRSTNLIGARYPDLRVIVELPPGGSTGEYDLDMTSLLHNGMTELLALGAVLSTRTAPLAPFGDGHTYGLLTLTLAQQRGDGFTDLDRATDMLRCLQASSITRPDREFVQSLLAQVRERLWLSAKQIATIKHLATEKYAGKLRAPKPQRPDCTQDARRTIPGSEWSR